MEIRDFMWGINMAVFDFKKEYKELYLPGSKPYIIDVPKMRFIMVDGKVYQGQDLKILQRVYVLR